MRGFSSLSTTAFALVRGHKTMRTLPIRSSTSTTTSHHHLSYSQILKQRRAVRNFDSQREVTTDILLKILKESQSAPSSFNLQPYKVIVVRSKAQREALSKAMIGFNVQRVLNAPVTVVILADKYGSANTRKLIELEKKNNGHPMYIEALPAMVSFAQGAGKASRSIKATISHILSPLRPMPMLESSESWAYKNASLYAQMFMIAATANGLGTCAMEGFDARRVNTLLYVDEKRYSIPMIISAGYVSEGEERGILDGSKQQPRFESADVYYEETYGEPLHLQGGEEPAR